MRPLVLIGLACTWSCAHTVEAQLTAPEHRAEAARHEAAAGAELRAYDPAAEHLGTADRELLAAADHLRAARSLEAFEDICCRDLPREQRSACPLLASSVSRVVETSAGIMLELEPGVDAVDTLRRLECHLAYAVAHGFDRPSCPLFVRGMKLALVLGPGTRSIVMAADDPLVAAELRAQARRIFRVEPAVTALDVDALP